MHFPSSAKKKEKLRETSAHDATGSLKKTLNKNLMQLKHPLRKIKHPVRFAGSAESTAI
jgi:hypothetical protein